MATATFVLKYKDGKALVNDSGDSIIYLLYCHDSKTALFSTGIKIKPNCWNQKSQKVSLGKSLKKYISEENKDDELLLLKQKEDKLTNRALEVKKAKIMAICRDIECRGLSPTAALVKSEYLNQLGKTKKETTSFLDYYKIFIEETKDKISNVNKGKQITQGSINQYNSSLATLIEFQKETGFKLEFSKIDKNFYTLFRNYLIKNKNLSINTFGNKIKKIKTFLNWCQERDLMISNKYKEFEAPANYEEAEALKGDEVLSIWNYKPSTPIEEKYLDCLLALISSGMRISDYNTVMTNMDKFIKDTSEGKAIVFKAQKTACTCVIPFDNDLYFRIEYLYKKYNGKMPKIPGQKLNKAIQEIQLKIGIDRFKITSKSGRKTLVSIKLYEQQLNAEIIMKITGHKTRDEFDKYAGIDHSDILKANREKSTHLKVG